MHETDGRRSLDAMFFARDPREVAPELLGKLLLSLSGDRVTGGPIVETEAYLGANDPGSHAAKKGVTKRNVVMYGPPGTVYVYFVYGNHHMLNLVCGPEGSAGAVLVRALGPVIGIETMAARRGARPLTELTDGPGKLAVALGVDLSDNGTALGQGRLDVYDAPALEDDRIATSGRIGLSAGHELRQRYYVDGCPHVSKARAGRSSRGRARTKPVP